MRMASGWTAFASVPPESSSGPSLPLATLVSNDLVKRFWVPELSASKDMLVCRMAVLVLSAITFLLALTVTGILKMLLVALTLTTSYTLVVLMTMLWPGACRRGSAVWTLGMTKLALVAWLVAPESWRVFPHPVYFLWLVSLVTFGLVAAVDRRRID